MVLSWWDVSCRLPARWPWAYMIFSVPRVDPVPHDAPKPPGYTRFVCVSDTHSRTDPIQMPYGDVLIHAGDFTELGLPSEVKKFNEWLGRCLRTRAPCPPPFLPALPGPSLAFVTCLPALVTVLDLRDQATALSLSPPTRKVSCSTTCLCCDLPFVCRIWGLGDPPPRLQKGFFPGLFLSACVSSPQAWYR